VTGERRCLICDAGPPFAPVFQKDQWTLVRCDGCGLVFQEPQPTAEHLSRTYYTDESHSDALLGTMREWTLERAREKVPLLRGAGVALRGARILDVGCSSGAWLEVAAGEGAHATGIELGPKTAADARERGLDVRTGTLTDAAADLPPGGFDLINFWDVLEHLSDPRVELDATRGCWPPAAWWP
jgi:2-polyprenyl-3-methyl-5-hydroxy-6-metoxy-1,4-benzoquinol methylase